MARPRSFRTEQVVEAAKRAFWDRGYHGTAVEDLEAATGLNRSSLYGAFGAKQAIFDRALGAYVDGFIAARLAPMEGQGAGVGDIEGFFAGLAELFRTDEAARRGCLMVNSIAEFEGRSTALDGRGAAFRDRLRTAFTNALGPDADPGALERHARMLTAATLGIWLSARMDPADAADACDAVITQVRTWR